MHAHDWKTVKPNTSFNNELYVDYHLQKWLLKK